MELTLHRALAMRKTTKARIEKEIRNGIYIETTIGNSGVVNGVPVEQVKKNIMSSYDKVTSLIGNLEALNRAISRANIGILQDDAVSQATLGDKKYVLSDLIQLKEINQYKRSFLRTLKEQNSETLRNIERMAAAVTNRCDTFLAGMGGGDKSKLSKEDIDAYTKSYHENNDARLVDPLNLQVLIPKMEKEIADFEVEVDSKISELNALTKIEVEIKD